MAARKHRDIVIPVALARALDDLLRQMDREGGVVTRINEFRTLAFAGEEVPVARRADARPELTESGKIDGILKTLPDMTGRQSFPDYVGNVGRAVIEDIHANARIMGRNQEGVAGTKAGADDAEIGEASLFEPIEAGARVDDGLASSVDGAADIGRNGIIGAREPGRRTRVVIGQAQAQGRDAEPLEAAAERIVLGEFGIPVRQEDDGLTMPSFGWKPARPNQVVLRIRSVDGRGEGEPFGFLCGSELEIARRIVAEEFATALDYSVIERNNDLLPIGQEGGRRANFRSNPCRVRRGERRDHSSESRDRSPSDPSSGGSGARQDAKPLSCGARRSGTGGIPDR